MNSTLDLSRIIRGYVRLENEDGVVVTGENLVVYTGGDIIAQLLAGNPEYQISHMYFGFENTAGVPAPPAAARSDLATLWHSLVAPLDFLRAAVLEPPQLSASDGNHNSNVATFNAISSATQGVNGVSFGSGSNSKVYDVGLLAAPTGVYTGDVLYAHYILPTALPAAGSGQVSATWATEAD